MKQRVIAAVYARDMLTVLAGKIVIEQTGKICQQNWGPEEKKREEKKAETGTQRDAVSTISQQKKEPRRRTMLDSYARDLTQAAKDGELGPLIGRESELSAMIQE